MPGVVIKVWLPPAVMPVIDFVEKSAGRMHCCGVCASSVLPMPSCPEPFEPSAKSIAEERVERGEVVETLANELARCII